MDKKFFGIPILVVCLLVCFIIMCNPFAMVGPGERGIKIRLGQVQPESYGEGLGLRFLHLRRTGRRSGADKRRHHRRQARRLLLPRQGTHA